MEQIFIKNIKINKVRHLKNLDIPVCENKCKHIIFTGKNGSGKTSVLDAISVFLNSITKGDDPNELIGYIEGTRERIQRRTKEGKEDEVQAYVEESINGDATAIKEIVAGKFTPGQISNTIAKLQLELKVDDGDFIANILNDCDQNIEAGFAEGYWSDHWDYNMDLVDNYLSIFPDKLDELVFKDNTYKFYDSVAYVVPRSEKYVINKKGAVRQYGMEVEDEEKLARPGFNKWATNWLQTKDQKPYMTTLSVKMIILALSKFAQLDVDGMGVEMEGGKPGWNDAMNGLPGLFGSGTPETFELKRLVNFIIDNFEGEGKIVMPAEIAKYLRDVKATLDKANAGELNDFEYWDAVATIRENYRETIKLYLSGEETEVSKDYINEVFSAFAAKIDKGIEKAVEMGNGLVPTYFTHEAVDFEPVVDENGNPVVVFNKYEISIGSMGCPEFEIIL